MPPPLDKNLFTLTIEESKDEPGATDLCDSDGVALYRRRRGDSKEGSYAINIFDHLSDSLLATVTALNATSKNKVIELHNPTIIIELNFTGRLSFKWNFVWEEHEFEWKKEECYILRKPDPPVLIAVTEPEKKNKKGIVQFLDYNLSRFDINDKKGLEVLLIASLLSFQDQSEEYRARASVAETHSGGLRAYQTSSAGNSTPALPPKPGEALVVKLQSSHKHEPNEIIVGSEGAVDEYVDLACNLLQDESMMFIMIRALDPSQVQRVVQVAEETKRTRRRARYEEELHQYLRYEDEQPAAPKGPKVIRLDGSPPKESPLKTYKPPQTLTIHLSKIPMPELLPIAPPPKPSGTQKVPTIRRPSPPSSRKPSSPGKSPANRNSFIGSLGGPGAGKSSPKSSGPINTPHTPKPGGVSANNPYNPYGRRQRPHSPTLENATPLSQKLQKPHPSRHPSGSSSVPYTESPHRGPPGQPYAGPPGGYPQSGPASPAPGTPGQPSTIHEFVKDGVVSLGSSLLGRFSTRK
ncbi:hypothetical protein V565_007080 [Rhizoctonia solani 123E]|uniref:Uncharacterized protein n=1 Tax=Rhizoctonia solani 123E TaxID=1423351 RepID=A0A074SZI0_9AGAM|nr:hypothetical protein V565_007080 [Rhizoctonia solani 123E]